VFPSAERYRQKGNAPVQSKLEHDRILRPKAAAQLIGVAKTRFYELVKTDGFPRPIFLGARARGYLASELMAWLFAQPRA